MNLINDQVQNDKKWEPKKKKEKKGGVENRLINLLPRNEGRGNANRCLDEFDNEAAQSFTIGNGRKHPTYGRLLLFVSPFALF